MFPPGNVWSTPIDQLPVDVKSTAYVTSMGATVPIHPDFGSYPISSFPLNIVHGNSVPPATVYVAWPFTSDPGPYPIPVNAVIGPGGDDHLIVLDQDNCILYESFATTQNADGSFNVDNIVKFDLHSYAMLGPYWSSSNAAGTPQLPLLVRYDEIVNGYIGHALSITGYPTANFYIWPATHSAAADPTAAPFGTRFRLRADYDISTFSPTNRIILQAMKTYGIFLTDNGSSWHLQGVPDPRWNDGDLHLLTLVPGSAFEVVDESSLEVDPASSQVSTPVTAAASVNPSAGTGLSQSFTFIFPGSGYQQAHMLVNTGLTGVSACYVIYDAASSSLYLATDDGNHVTSPLPIGSTSKLSNSQCSLPGSSVTVTKGDDLTITLGMNFVPGFTGAKKIYTSYADSNGTRAGWRTAGSWNVPVSAAPDTVMPTGGVGASQAFSFSFTHAPGALDYGQVHMLFNSTLAGSNACYAIYDRFENRWGISGDDGNGVSQWAPAGTDTVLKNSQCSFPVSSATATFTATNLTVNFTPTFAASFAGLKNIYIGAEDWNYHFYGWQQIGTWTVTPGTEAVSVTPSAGTGLLQNFTFIFTNSWGPTNYSQVHMLFNSGFTGLNSCYLIYDRYTGRFGIGNNEGSDVAQWAYPGSATVLSNSQCDVPMANATAQLSDTAITITITPLFAPSFLGPKNIYTETRDPSYIPSPWNQAGIWTVSE